MCRNTTSSKSIFPKFTYYAIILLFAFANLFFQKFCRHNRCIPRIKIVYNAKCKLCTQIMSTEHWDCKEYKATWLKKPGLNRSVIWRGCFSMFLFRGSGAYPLPSQKNHISKPLSGAIFTRSAMVSYQIKLANHDHWCHKNKHCKFFYQ